MCKIIFRPTIINGPCVHTQMYLWTYMHTFMCYFLSNPYIATITTCERMQITFMEQECISLSHRLIIRSLYYNYVTKSTFQNSCMLLLPSFDAPFVLSMWYTSFSSNFKYDQKTLIHNISSCNSSKIILQHVKRLIINFHKNDFKISQHDRFINMYCNVSNKMKQYIICQRVVHYIAIHLDVLQYVMWFSDYSL